MTAELKEKSEIKAAFEKLMAEGLSRTERLVLILYYFEKMTMAEIAKTLNIEQSSVEQIHAAIKQRAKAVAVASC